MSSPTVLWRHSKPPTFSQQCRLPRCHLQASGFPDLKPLSGSVRLGTKGGAPFRALAGSAMFVPHAAARAIGPKSVKTLRLTPPTRRCRGAQLPLTPRLSGEQRQEITDNQLGLANGMLARMLVCSMMHDMMSFQVRNRPLWSFSQA